MNARRLVQFILGALWFLDGLLQLQPNMFSPQLVSNMMLPMAQNQPAWIAHSILWAAHLIHPHEWLYNIGFASIQLVIGFWLMVNFNVRVALALSFVWALMVWWFGEGFGQLATGQALLLTGAPGAVVLYAVIGWMVWPSEHLTDTTRRNIARYSLALFWILGAILQAQPAYRNGTSVADLIDVKWASHIVLNVGVGVIWGLSLVQVVLGVLILTNRQTYLTIPMSVALSFLFWWLGQDFGQLLNGMATDPNAGPLMMMLSLCMSQSVHLGIPGFQREEHS